MTLIKLENKPIACSIGGVLLIVLCLIRTDSSVSVFAKPVPKLQNRVPAGKKTSSSPKLMPLVPKLDDVAPLKLHVEQVERLAMLTPSLRPGELFDENKLPKNSTALQWYPIPNFMGGIWQSYYLTTYFEQDYTTGKVFREKRTGKFETANRWGWQRDAKGNLWSYADLPNYVVVKEDKIDQLQYITAVQPLSSTEARFVSTVCTLIFAIDRTTRQIVNVNQVVSTQAYTMADNNSIQCVGRAKAFAYDGSPKKLQNTVSLMHKRSNFSPIDFRNGKDMKRSFRQFLLSRGLNDLVPEK